MFNGCGCDDCDTELFPEYLPDPCITEVKQGGVSGWVAVRCSSPFVDITSQTEWETKLTDGDLRGRVNGCRVKGGIPAPEYTTINRGACGAEETVSKSQTITIQDLENDPNFTGHTLYDYIDRKGDKWDFYFVNCDFSTVGPYTGNGVRAYSVTPETNEEDQYFEMVINTRIPRGVLIPVSLPFLENLPLNAPPAP